LQGNGILIFLVPIGVFIVASIESIYYWLLRKKAFGFLSLSFVVSTSVATILKVLFASYEMGWLGLVLAYLIGAFLSLLLLSFKFFKESNIVKKFSLFKRKGLFDTAKKYRKFPFYSMPADGLNSFTDQLPNLLLNGFFGSGVVGFYSLTQNVLGLPIKFISSAMTDVYRERASVDCREKGNCKGIFTSTLRNLVLFSIIPFLVIFFFSPIAIPFILGNQWYEVGAYIKILTPLFLFRFIASPLGSTLYIRGKQKILLLWQIVLLILTATSLYLGNLIGDEYTSLMLLSASYSIMYVILLLLGYKFSSMRNEETF
jgi:O-antigen/teichoic acid export membrane protein